MKILFTVILVSGLLFSTGCDEVKSLLDVKFDANYTVDLNMNVPAEGTTKSVQSTFQGSTTIDPTSNSDVSKYLDLIKSWQVTKLTGTFKNVSKEAVLENGTITFSSDAGKATWTFTNIAIKNGGTFTLDNTDGQWDEVDKILNAKKAFTVSVQGKTNISGFTFTLSVAVNTQVVANPLGAK